MRARLAAAKSNQGLASENLEVIPGLDDDLESVHDDDDEENEDDGDDEASREARFAAMEKEMDDLQQLQASQAAGVTAYDHGPQPSKKARTGV